MTDSLCCSCEGVIVGFVFLFYGFNGAHGFDEHAAGEV